MSVDNEVVDDFTLAVGAFLGESIIECYGGKWQLNEDAWSIVLKDGGIAFVFGKVAKFIEFGEEESFVSMFRMIPTMSSIDSSEATEDERTIDVQC